MVLDIENEIDLANQELGYILAQFSLEAKTNFVILGISTLFLAYN